MGKHYEHNEFGGKQKIRVKINGEFIDREFRNEGEARKYLEAEGYTKDDIRRGVVKIVR